MDKFEALNELSKQIYAANKEKGFWDKKRNVGEMLMLVTSELGEAMEAHRKGRFANFSAFKAREEDVEIFYFESDFQDLIKDSFQDEIADAIIRLLDMCGGLNIDIAKSVELKLKYNATRERMHGKLY